MQSVRDSEGFAQTVRALRAEGWKNWHIIQSVSNLIFNYRAGAFSSPHPDQAEFMAQLTKVQEEFESGAEFDAVPIEYLTEEWLQRMISGSIASTLRAYGLDMKQQTPDLNAIDKFVRQRFRYWDMDVECPEAEGLLPDAGS